MDRLSLSTRVSLERKEGKNEATKVEAATLIRVSRVRGESHQLIKRVSSFFFTRYRPAEYSKSASRLFRDLINCSDPLCPGILSLPRGILFLGERRLFLEKYFEAKEDVNVNKESFKRKEMERDWSTRLPRDFYGIFIVTIFIFIVI